MENRYKLYTDGKITGTSSPTVEWIKEHIENLLNAGIVMKQFDIYEILDEHSGNIVYKSNQNASDFSHVMNGLLCKC